MQPKWPEPRINKRTNPDFLNAENNGWNAAIEACKKVYEESPKLVELDELKLKKFVIECGYFSAVGVNYTTIVDRMIKAICANFGITKAGLEPKNNCEHIWMRIEEGLYCNECGMQIIDPSKGEST